eukprot:gnl/MRDRNA2_/MRDRNA2_209315_c0_seq1.p1 gnl/MRDRNA2_/MRDRNA2_209315_c0~~gnl/MRDRNA2_/MRDRNA2_209315_c0_seq1.p1  ORF type:complete len:376 (+),score=56.65 gnl/MRDRNA2_/MRDRNA2_209315_c0_seq1:94-1128(+)
MTTTNLKGQVVHIDDLPPSASFSHGNVVCFVVKPNRMPVAVITREDCKVSVGALAKALKVGKNKLTMAHSVECSRLFGYVPGTVPPVGLRPGVQVWLSTSLRTGSSSVFCFSAGNSSLRLLLDVDSLAAHYDGGCWLADEEQHHVPLTLALDRVACGDMPLQFSCDSMLNRLAHKLRALDLDTIVIEDSQVAGLARREQEQQLVKLTGSGRISITCSKTTFSTLKGYVYLLQSSSVEEQVREVCAVFGIDGKRRAEKAMDQRCCMCNGILKRVGKKEVQELLPKQTVEAYDSFFLCSTEACNAAYWHGGTYEEALREVRRIVAEPLFEQSDKLLMRGAEVPVAS